MHLYTEVQYRGRKLETIQEIMDTGVQKNITTYI